MKLDPNQTLAGVPILRVRAFLRKVHERRWAADAIEAAFPDAGSAILEALIEEGYVEPCSDLSVYKTTLKGDELVRASVPKPAPAKKRRP